MRDEVVDGPRTNERQPGRQDSGRRNGTVEACAERALRDTRGRTPTRCPACRDQRPCPSRTALESRCRRLLRSLLRTPARRWRHQSRKPHTKGRSPAAPPGFVRRMRQERLAHDGRAATAPRPLRRIQACRSMNCQPCRDARRRRTRGRRWRGRSAGRAWQPRAARADRSRGTSRGTRRPLRRAAQACTHGRGRQPPAWSAKQNGCPQSSHTYSA